MTTCTYLKEVKMTTKRELIEAYPPSDECAVWDGANNGRGYGYFEYVENGKCIKKYAHRYSYEYHVGDIPEGLDIDHICGNPSCFNPKHLRTATRGQNAQNRWNTSKSSTGWRGVSTYRNGKRWTAGVQVDGKRIHLGTYGCPTHAGLVALSARNDLAFRTGARPETITGFRPRGEEEE